MLNKLHSAAISAYCSVLLSSVLLNAAPQAYQSAAMALPDAVQAKIQTAVSGLTQSGWAVSANAPTQNLPDASASAVQSQWGQGQNVGELARAAELVYSTGKHVDLKGVLSTALGLTQNEQTFPMQQKLIEISDLRHTFNVSRARGRVDIVMFYRTQTQGTFYLTSLHGDLEKAMYATTTGTQDLPLGPAKADFEKEKAWWLKQFEAVP